MPDRAAQRDHRRAGRAGRPRHGVARRRRRAGRSHRASRRSCPTTRQRCSAGRWRRAGGAERRRRADRLDRRCPSGGCSRRPIVLVDGQSSVRRAYDAVVDDVYAAGADEVVDPGRRRVRRLVARRCQAPVASRRRTCARRSPSPATAPVAEGVVGAGTRHGHDGPQGGHRHGVTRVDGARHDRRAAAVQLRRRSSSLRIGGRARRASCWRRRAQHRPLDTGGCCIGVVVTDLPLDARQLERVARRVGLGLARIGLGRAPRQRRHLLRRVDDQPSRHRGARGTSDVDLLADAAR